MQVVRSVLEAAVLIAWSEWRPRFRYSSSHCRELLPFAGPLIAQSIWTFVNDELPKVVLGLFLGPAAVGIYAFARRPLELLTQGLLNPLIMVAMPAVSRIQGDPEKIDRFFDTTVRIAGIVGVPAFIGFAAVAPEAVPLIFGDQWTSAVVAVQILMLIGLLRTVDSLCGLTILALGHSGLILKMNILYTIIAAVLLPAGARISVNATMVALVACHIALVPLFLYLAQRFAGVDVLRPLTVFPRVAFAAALMFLAVTAWRLGAPDDLGQVLIVGFGIFIGASVYGAAAFLLLRSDILMAQDILLRLKR